MNQYEEDALAEMRAALKDPNVSIKFVHTFTHGRAVQVHVKTRKVGPRLFPAEGQTIADVLHMLGTMALEDGA